LSAKLKLAEDREKGYLEALNSEKKKKKRSQPFTEELRAEAGVSVLFFSPSKVQKARELQDTRETAFYDSAPHMPQDWTESLYPLLGYTFVIRVPYLHMM
jgi:hypothetical protein